MNSADGPSRRPNYQAQGELSLVQKDLLASKLIESNPDLSETARLNSELCDIVKCQLCKAAGPKLDIVAGSEFKISLPEAELCDTARATWRVNAQSPLVDSEG